MCEEISPATSSRNTDQSRNHETVIADVLSNARCSRAIKADAGKIGRIRWQEEISIASRDEGKNQDGIDSCIERQGNNDRNGSTLRINKL